MTKPQARILVVDDERNIRKNLGMVLEAAGSESAVQCYPTCTTGRCVRSGSA